MRFAAADKRDLPQLATVVSQAVFDWKYGTGQGDSDAEIRLRKHAQGMILELRRAFESGAATGITDELIRLLADTAPRGDEIKNALIAWVSLVEALVQEAEQEYGSAPHRGAQKSEQVKAVLIHLMIDRPHLQLLDIPDFLVPFIAEIGVNWTIDAIVLILNQHTMWEPGPVEPSLRLSLFARIIHWLFVCWRAFIKLAPVARLLNSLSRLTRRVVLLEYPLSPKVRIAVQRIETMRGATIESVVSRVVAVVRWFGDHHNAMVALAGVVAFAIQEAEFIGGLSGPEKKIYARALLLAFLADVGMVGAPSSLSYHLADSILDSAIDAVVLIFNTRAESFGKRGRQPSGTAATSVPLV
jgi:hypothetical protein